MAPLTPLPDLPDDHDLAHLRVMLPLFTGRRTAVDGGAHRGIWTRELAEHFERVHAFEPVPGNAARIGVGTVWEMALGDGRETLLMAAGHENTGQWHVSPDGCLMVKQAPLDALSIPDLDFLKLDVEGYELHALRGARGTIERCKPAIMVELCGDSTPAHAMVASRYGRTDDDVHQWLMAAGYRMKVRQKKDYLYLPVKT